MDISSHSAIGVDDRREVPFCSIEIGTENSAPQWSVKQNVAIGLERANRLNFGNIKMKLLSAEFNGRYTTAEIEENISLYREFLAIHFAYRDFDIVPSKDVDTIWHQHILDTRAYHKDCEFLFGRFLHHYPYFGLNGPEDASKLAVAFQKTCDIWKVHFGRSPAPHSFESCSKCGGGSCSSCR